MNPEQQQEQPQGAWVRLFLAAQIEGSSMPEFIEGYLTEETPGSYVFSHVMRTVEDEHTGMDVKRSFQELTFISRTYVWRCSILDRMPEDFEDHLIGDYSNDMGGMG